MQVKELTTNEDGSKVFNVMFDEQEVKELTEIQKEQDIPSLEGALQNAIEVGMGY